MVKGYLYRTGLQMFCSALSFLQIQNPENLVTCRHSVHGNVEERTKESERNEKFRCQKDNGKCSGKADVSVRVFQYGDDHSDGRAAVGDKIHHTDRIQLHGQYLHGNLAEAFGLLVHLTGFHPVCLIDFQSCQSLQIFQKTVAELRVDSPVFIQQFFGEFLHRHNGYRNQRHTDQKNEACLEADRRQHKKQCDRSQKAVKQLRKIFSIVDLQLFHPFGSNLYDLGSRHLFFIRCTDPQKFFINLAAQHKLDIGTCPARSDGGHFFAAEADKKRKNRNDGGPGPDSLIQCAVHQTLQKRTCRKDGRDLKQKSDPLPENILDNIFFRSLQKLHEPCLDHIIVLLLVFSFLLSSRSCDPLP